MTKSLIYALMIMLFTAGCEKYWRTISGETLIERDGIVYEPDSDTAFTGRAEWFHENGQLMTYIYYMDGKRNGVNEDFFQDGCLLERSIYIDGKRNGLHEEYYPNGQLMERRHYIYGRGNGLWERYSEAGTLQRSAYYIDGNTVPAQSAR